jgi:hypothetical protein
MIHAVASQLRLQLSWQSPHNKSEILGTSFSTFIDNQFIDKSPTMPDNRLVYVSRILHSIKPLEILTYDLPSAAGNHTTPPPTLSA